MKRISALLLILLLAAFALRADEAPRAGTQEAKTFTADVKRAVSLNYLLHLPAGYDAGGEKTWPLIVFLHGAGERGSDIKLVEKHGPPKLAAAGKAMDFIVVSPQCPAGVWWDRETVIGLVDQIIATHKVDKSRVYLTGLSMGGYGTWDVAAAFPDRFAAIAPICGGGSRHWASTLLNTPIWAFHGELDKAVPVEESKRMIDFVLTRRKDAAGPEVNLTLYPDAGHDCWTVTYDNPELYEWFLKHRREMK